MSSSITIAEVRKKCKSLVAKIPRDILVLGVLILTSFASFGLGYLAGSGEEGKGANVVEALPSALTTADLPGTPQAGQVVASKNGTKYYPPECAGVDRISEANKVWFASAVAAVAAGYAPAANCK